MIDPDPMGLIVKLMILFGLILINAFFAMSEIAIIALNDNKVRKMAEEGHKGAQKVLKLTENPSNFLSTIQIGVTLAGFLTSASAAGNFSEPLAAKIAELFTITTPAMLSLLNGVSLIIVTIVIAYFSLVLGELVPKRIGMQKYEKVSFKVVGVLLAVKTVMSPFIKLLSASTNIILRIFGIDPFANEETVTEEEILMMVDAGEERGVIEGSQKEMINNIFEFDDIVAGDVMTHRTDIEALDIGSSIAQAIEITIAEGYSRLPVFEEDLDNVKGVLYVKDLLQFVGKPVPPKITLTEVVREAHFVPESKRCGELFAEMTEKHIQMVMVVDEYGGVAGLVTIEDLLESIVGNIQDEFDNEEVDFERLGEHTYIIEGITDIEEVEEMLAIKLPEGEYDTIGGFIMSSIGRIPGPDESPTVEAAGFEFTVLEMDERRIERVRAERLPQPEENGDKK